MKLTSATPTSSAAAVDAVRRGLRIAFWRARPAGRPRHATSGQPSVLASGRRGKGAQRCEPDECQYGTCTDDVAFVTDVGEETCKQERQPDGEGHRADGRPRPFRSTRLANRVVSERGDRRNRGGAKSREHARHERRPVPSASGTRTATRWIAGETDGRSSPAPGNTANSTTAPTIPSTTPTAAARRPTTRASASTEAISCARDAPRQRSSPSSLVRWATTMEKVFTTRNAATKSTIAPRTTRTEESK